MDNISKHLQPQLDIDCMKHFRLFHLMHSKVPFYCVSSYPYFYTRSISKITVKFCIVGSYTHILRLLVSEFTLSENPANTTCSMLRAACHTDESILLGASPLLHTDHRIVEDQVVAGFSSFN